MLLEWDEDKRQWTLEHRGLDFADAGKIFEGPDYTQRDDRFDYPEVRFQTYGLLDGRMAMLAWTPIQDGIRVISMRRCNDREQKAFNSRLG